MNVDVVLLLCHVVIMMMMMGDFLQQQKTGDENESDIDRIGLGIDFHSYHNIICLMSEPS